MAIIIPMAGLSSRFTKAGFNLPKYMLYAKNKSLFNLAVSSFSSYFSEEKFVFIARNIFDSKTFISEECKLLGITDYQIVILKEKTRGQAETVFYGLENAELEDNESILIFNIDTFRPDFLFPKDILKWDGYLEVFKGSGRNWSYAETESEKSTRVVRTAEKREISDNCSTGIYYFKNKGLFYSTYLDSNENSSNIELNELYVAPLYNYLIQKGYKIHINVIERDEVIFCGIPSEYYEYLDNIN